LFDVQTNAIIFGVGNRKERPIRIEPHDLPPTLQAALHRDGLLHAPDFLFGKTGQVIRNIPKLLAYIEAYGEPYH
jgi:hypothetical protein